jgi:hypothetical protein
VSGGGGRAADVDVAVDDVAVDDVAVVVVVGRSLAVGRPRPGKCLAP